VRANRCSNCANSKSPNNAQRERRMLHKANASGSSCGRKRNYLESISEHCDSSSKRSVNRLVNK